MLIILRATVIVAPLIIVVVNYIRTIESTNDFEGATILCLKGLLFTVNI